MRMDQTLGRDKPFTPNQSHITKLIIFVALSILLISLDQRGEHISRIRTALSVITYPIQVTAAIPGIFFSAIADSMDRDDDTIEEEYQKLKTERPLLLARLQRYEALEAENKRLRLLLDSAERVANKAIVAELLEVHPDPFTQTIIIARGSSKGVFRGQPVIDAHGVMGQITQVAAFNSTVTLLTDPGHAVPVMVKRTGLRTIVVGGCANASLNLPYLTNSADVREGDMLVTSGMGGRFPPGYPVGHISSIKDNPNETHMWVTAKPAAQLNHYKEVLLVWPQQKEKEKEKAGGDKAGKAS
jgi:rod shape-determining protein MreC